MGRLLSGGWEGRAGGPGLTVLLARRRLLCLLQVLLAQQVELRRMCEAYAALAERSNNYMRMAVALPEAVSAAPQQLMLGQLPP